jgi:hypothetical protein
MSNSVWLKSAISAAKKKNNVISEILYLTGDEDQVLNQPNNKRNGKQNTGAKKESVVPHRAKVEKTPSLKNTLSKINQIGKDSSGEVSEEKGNVSKNDSRSRDPFTIDQVEERWVIFVERLKKKEVRMYAALKSIKPILLENDTIELSFQNNAQLEEYQIRYKPQLTSEFQNALNNEYIELTERVIESEKLEKPTLLSDKEKLQQMVEKNPSLQNLMKKFKLDFE